MKKRIIKSLFNILLSVTLLLVNITFVFAASASISVSSSTSKIVVGNSFTVTYKISSSTALGSWRFTPSYDSSKFKLVSGDSSVVDYAKNSSTKSKSYTYKFKAIGTGSGTIGIRVAEAYSYSESSLNVSKGSKSIKVISQSEYQSSLSKNNNLSTLSVNGFTLSPTFSSNVTDYKVSVPSNTTNVKITAKAQDSKSDISGTGSFNVAEGENKFTIVVTAQNGSVKKYNVIINVIDPNPIKITIDGEEYVVVKRESNLESPEHYEKKEIKINEQTVPGFYNESNNFTLVGLKNSESDTELFIYDESNNTYSLYKEATLDKIKIYPLKMDKEITNYSKSTVNIDEIEFEALKMNNSDYYVIHAKNLDDGKIDYYIYDSKNNSIIRYTDENTLPLLKEINKYKKITLILTIETIFIILMLIGILINKVHKDKKRKLKKEKMLKEKEKRNKEKTEQKKKEVN